MAGFSSVTSLENIVFADNASFDGTKRGGAMTTNGQLWIGSTAAPHVKVGSITSPSGTVTIGYSSPNITLDANTSLLIQDVDVQTGTSPVVPLGGTITINGATVPAGTNPVRSDGTGPNTLALEVQTSQALAASDVTKIGLSNFDSAAFTVDANGFVQLSGGGVAAISFEVQANTSPGTNPVLPTSSGLVTINGAAVANHSVVLETRSRAANSYNLEVQYATTSASTDATKSGVAHFDSTKFTVDANGFVTTSGTGIMITLTGNTGGAISPVAGNINTVGIGSITIAGSGNTLTTELTGLTNHNVLIGAGTPTITNVSPSATSGVPLISQGASADPLFGTAVVAGGGTGNTSFTAFSVIAAGTTTTGPFQNVSGVGTSGQILTSNGAAALPTWQNSAPGFGINKVIRQVFTTSGTYTPSTGMLYCDVEVLGPGGGGGGAAATGAATIAAGGGGGAGGYSRKIFTAATIGASQTVTIGTGGAGGAAGNNAGSNGSASSALGLLISATQGLGGAGCAAGVIALAAGGVGGTGVGGDFVITTGSGGPGVGSNVAGFVMQGIGGGSFYSGSTTQILLSSTTGTNIGIPGRLHGGGGSGAVVGNSSAATAGGAGNAGMIVITEYTS